MRSALWLFSGKPPSSSQVPALRAAARIAVRIGPIGASRRSVAPTAGSSSAIASLWSWRLPR